MPPRGLVAKQRARKEPVVDPEVARVEEELTAKKGELERVLAEEKARLEELRWAVDPIRRAISQHGCTRPTNGVRGSHVKSSRDVILQTTARFS